MKKYYISIVALAPFLLSACANNQVSAFQGGKNIDAPPKSKPYTAPSTAPGGIQPSTSPVVENQWYWKQSNDGSNVTPPPTQQD